MLTMTQRLPRLRAFALLLSFLVPPLAAQDKTPKPEPDKGTKQASGKIDFAAQVLPILEKNCFKCHRSPYTDEAGKPRRPKGGVVLDTKDGITTSKKGKVVVAKKPGESKMIAAISLPKDDEDRMPPAKEAADPLPKEQIELLRKWVEQGAEFGSWTGKDKGKDQKPGDAKPGDAKPGEKGKTPAPGKDAPAPGGDKGHEGGHEGGHDAGDDELRELAADLEPLEKDARAQLRRVHALTEPLVDDCELLRVSFLGSESLVDDDTLAALDVAKQHIGELVLARTNVTDAGCAAIAKLPHLVRLDLRQTRVGDAGVRALAAAPHLRSLNLFGSQVGDAGVAALAQCKTLRDVYLWQTPAAAAAVVALQHELPDARIVFSADLPEPLTDTPQRGGRGKR